MAGPCTVQATQAGNSTYAAAPPVNQTFTVTASSSGLLLYYNLMTNATATTATDLSGNGYNGTFSSSPISWIFDGKTASVSGFSSVAPTTTASFVVVFNLNSTPSSEETLFSLNGGGNGRISGSAGSSGFVWDFGNTSGETNSNARLYANPSWTVSGGWHTVVFTVTTGAMAIWLDGSEIASGTTSVAATPSGNMMIGDWIGSPGGSNQTLGMIASVLVYNRVLSSTEISNIGTYFGSEPRNSALATLASNGLAQTPPMGWGSWESFNVGATESEIEGNADYLVSTGLNAVGYTQIGIDGGKVTRVSGALQGNPVNFPDGIPAISTYIHNKGLKFWFYGAPGTVDCQSQTAEWTNEYADAQTYASWGVDYYKYDWCSAQNAFSGYAGWTDSNWAQFLYQWMAQQLRATGRPIIFSGSSVNQGFLSGTSWESWAPSAGLNLFRNTPDILDSWTSIMSNLEGQVGLDGYAGPGHWNDPDYLEVGVGGITDAQGQAQMSLWSVIAAPLNIGADLRSASANTIATLGNLDVINIDQDPMGVEGKRVSSTNCGGSPCEVWARPLSGGYCAIALLNQDSNEAHNLTANFATIAATVPGCGTGPFTKTLNVWANWPVCTANHCGAPMGTLTDSFTATVPATSAFLFTVGN
jgi:alpha-galactosidase